MTRTIEQDNFDHEAQRIRVGVSKVLKKWGLLPRFKRWRLAKDPGTGMVVLFGVLNNGYLAAHTSTPFTDYFQPGLLRDLADQLQVQLVSCNTDGLRYAFILDHGQLDTLPSHIDFPYTDNGKVAIRVAYDDNPRHAQALAEADDRNRLHRGIGALLRVFDDIQLRNDAAYQLSAQSQPDVLVISEGEFNRRVAEQEAEHRRNKRIRELFDQ